MATTAGGTPYVESSDLVADYPTVSLALAEHIDDLPATVLQIVRATDTTERSTTSTSFVDVTGMSVTITPQKNTSAILLLSTVAANIAKAGNTSKCFFTITDSSNNSLSGAESFDVGLACGGLTTVGFNVPVQTIGRSTPATLSATTYKLRFKVDSGTTLKVLNNLQTGQLFAIEVSA
jgi:hypothetical protein